MRNSPRCENDLIAALADSGEIPIDDALMRRHVGDIRAMIYPMVLNDADADDLTQEVLLRVLRGVDRFRGDAQFSTWLYRVTLNTARSFLRRQKRRLVVWDEVPDNRTDRRADLPEELAMASELDDAVTAALESLSPTLRAAIVLTTLQGLDVREAAHVEGCTTATMYWRVHKARKLLERLLARHLK